jgi:zinc metalloprotease ZmpB
MHLQTKRWFALFLYCSIFLYEGCIALLGQIVPNEYERQYKSENTFRKLNYPLPEGYTIPDVLGKLSQFKLKYTASPFPTELSFLHQNRSTIGHWLTFQQLMAGYPMEGSTLRVLINPEGVITLGMDATSSISNQIIDPSFIYPLTRITEELGHRVGEKAIVRTDSIWYNDNGKWLTVYKVMTNLESTEVSNTYYFDAVTGILLNKVSNGCSYGCRTHSIGIGNAFCPDPMTTLRAYYKSGTPYADNSDSNNTSFDSAYCKVVLKDLMVRNDSSFLQGPYVKITDIRSPRTPITASLDGYFFFNRSETGFEDVNVYYHIDTMQRYIQSMGLLNLCNFPIQADPHGQTFDNSAFFVVDTFQYLLFGTGGVDDAEDADVIIHEYTHALANAASPRTIMGFERRSLEEGIADYFAASYSYRHSPFRWQDVYTWDGHNEFWPGRSANTTLTYQKMPLNNIYEVGQLWSTAMMGVLQEIGPTDTDKLALHQLYMNNSGMTLRDAALSLLMIDTILFQGRYSSVITKQFCKVGIFVSPLCPTSVLEGNRQLQKSPQAIIYPNPCSDALTVEIEQTYPQHYRYQWWNNQGILLFEGEITEKKYSIPLSDLNHGLYLLMLYRSGFEDQAMQVFKVLKQ